MKLPTWPTLPATLLLVLAVPAGSAAQASVVPPGAGQKTGPAAPILDAPIPILWLEPAAGAVAEGELPLYTPIPPDDMRAREADRLLDNEAADFTRTLVAWAWRTFPPPADWTPPRLPIVLAQGGNNAAHGFRLLVDGKVVEHAGIPVVVLQADSTGLAGTLMHEGGHLLHAIATAGRRPTPWWTAIVHSTFAVTDPLTALSEGYAIHFETLWAHFGRQADMRAYYHRLSPAFDARTGRRAEFYSPIADLMTFSQSWARYQAVRETWPAFVGHVYPGDYLRSQYDPARDRAVLKPASAMIASEGVVASTLFWTVASLAQQGGSKPGEGLRQQALLDAEQALLRGFAALPEPEGFRPDVVDLVSAIGAPASAARRTAISRFVSVTRGVTARTDIRPKWTALYHDAIGLDFDAATPIIAELDEVRAQVVEAAAKDPATLRKAIGPVVPVRAPKVPLELKVLRQRFELDFDLNAATEAEWLAAGVDAAAAQAILQERDAQPFASIREFEKRTGKTLAALGLVAVER